MQTEESQEDALREKVGLTKQELAQRVAELKAQQKAAESRLEKEQKAQISAVTGDIAGVKTDVGGVKTDVASTKADLEATKAKLQSTIGDLGVQSGLIAHTAGDLEILKHKGDRNYYEFTLLQGRQAAAGLDRQPATEEGRRQEGQVHHERDLRRQDDREEGSQCLRADSVLLRTRSHAV